MLILIILSLSNAFTHCRWQVTLMKSSCHFPMPANTVKRFHWMAQLATLGSHCSQPRHCYASHGKVQPYENIHARKVKAALYNKDPYIFSKIAQARKKLNA